MFTKAKNFLSATVTCFLTALPLTINWHKFNALIFNWLFFFNGIIERKKKKQAKYTKNKKSPQDSSIENNLN